MADRHDEDDEAPSFLDSLISQETRRRTREQTQPLIDACCTPGCVRTSVLVGCVVALLITTLIIVIHKTAKVAEDLPTIKTTDPPTWMLLQAQQDQLETHMRYLSSDLLEGRGPGTRGEALSAAYISSHFKASGLNPLPSSGTTSQLADPYIQKVPMIGRTLDYASMSVTNGTAGTINFNYLQDFTMDSEQDNPLIELHNEEMVFGGNCVYSPKEDDFKHEVIKGKVIICLMEPLKTEEMSSFAADYYGSLSTKLQYLRAQNPLGVLLVHPNSSSTNTTPAYSWDVYQNRFGVGEQLTLQNQTGALYFKGWISQQVADRIARVNNMDLSYWIYYARQSYARPTPLSQSRLSLTANFTVRNFVASNVVAYLGPSPAYSGSNPLVVLAHHDYLGIRPYGSTLTDTIYNGAVDNASGVSAMLTAAYALGALYKEPFIINPLYAPPRLEKSIIFMASTGHEGMLGISHFVQNSTGGTCGAYNCSTVINFDIMNVWGGGLTASVLGKNMSSMIDSIVNTSLINQGLINKFPTDVVPDIWPWPFITRTVPTIAFASGSELDPPPIIRYMTTQQYKPNDKFTNEINMYGVLQQVRVALRIIFSLAVKEEVPTIDNLDYLGLW